MKVFACQHCKNKVVYLEKAVCNVRCCGEEMVELVPNTSDGANEKHVPVITRDGQTVRVQVGSVAHPMLDAHSIEWIALETREGMQRKLLKPGMEPVAVFALTEGDEPVAAYEYCNLHGFWKAEA
ncbi:MAG: desulfoferrodoxin [Clostridia bacterium]|nr:desulfoferrodoxin [Clostridia bacterium]